jgi:23S rRNA (cytidine1920-2'-O)/16S rRNA (cytidine1409-2'-O)-methyltransferase
MAPGERLDVAMVQRGLADSRERAQGMILAGSVTVAGRRARASQRISSDTAIEIRSPSHAFVGRGGLKLAAGLDTFMIDVRGLIALDIGASTGGFTDCLLQRGAAKVYAVDVGYGQLAWRLRQDPRVVVIERCNARYLDQAVIQDTIQLATIDVSFISLRLILPAVAQVLDPNAIVLALLKPQFEIGKGKLGRGGIVRDEQMRQETVQEVRCAVEAQGWQWLGHTPSPITGQKGNIEFLVKLKRGDSQEPTGHAYLTESAAQGVAR